MSYAYLPFLTADNSVLPDYQEADLKETKQRFVLYNTSMHWGTAISYHENQKNIDMLKKKKNQWDKFIKVSCN